MADPLEDPWRCSSRHPQQEMELEPATFALVEWPICTIGEGTRWRSVRSLSTSRNQIFWQRVETALCRETVTSWSIVVPGTNILEAAAKLCFEEAISPDPELATRSTFALDRPMMEEIQDQTTFFVWDERIEAACQFRYLRIYTGGVLTLSIGKPGDTMQLWMGSHSRTWPWTTLMQKRAVMFSDIRTAS